MYRAFKGFYITPANIEYIDRRKPGNQFTLTLGPHSVNMSDIVHNLEPGMSKCGGGVMIDINGRKTLVKAFPITITGDMPAGADNSGFYRHNANLGCRAYKVPQSERGDVHFDIIHNGRYHFDTIFKRDEGQEKDGAQKTKFFKDLGLREESPAIITITPTLDLILGRGYDAPHSE
jgi:hypothetical protein